MGKRSKGASGGGTPATLALERAGVAYELHGYTHDPSVSDFGDEAAAALAVQPERVLKTLLAVVDGALVVGVVPVSGLLDLKALARVRGGKRAEMADVAVAERRTGYVAGGISTFGQKTRLPTVVDESAMQWESVFVSGGRRGLDIELAPADLVTVSAATVAPIARD